ncbi:MAG TPA: hypothetical protein VKA15_21065 [Isosphaeraceae bacterium]|nr:hypothetical protein [Isosphaeraceae bacterium]
MFRNRLAAGLTLCALALVLAPNQAQAQVEPFAIIGGGFAPTGIPLPGQPPRPHWAIGGATTLGIYYGQGEVQTDTATFNADGTITGEFASPVPFVFAGAHGDTLACYYGNTDFGATSPGTFELVPVPGRAGWYVAHFVAEFVPYDPECTGKFRGVSGGWIMYATTDPFLLGSSEPLFYWWEGQGSLTFSKGH